MTSKVHIDAVIGKPDLQRIERLWAYVCVDKDGNEGIAGGNIGPGGSFLPFMGADEARIRSLRPYVEALAKITPELVIRFVEFTGRIDHGAIGSEN